MKQLVKREYIKNLHVEYEFCLKVERTDVNC